MRESGTSTASLVIGLDSRRRTSSSQGLVSDEWACAFPCSDRDRRGRSLRRTGVVLSLLFCVLRLFRSAAFCLSLSVSLVTVLRRAT